MREAGMNALPGLGVRAVIALFATALLFTTFAAGAQPAAADLSARITNARSGQLYSERLMRKQDRAVARIVQQRRKANRKIRRTGRIIRRRNKSYAASTKILRTRAARLRDAEARYPDPAEAPNPAIWAAKMQVLRRDLRRAQDQRRQMGNKVRIARRAVNARRGQLRGLRRQWKAAVRQREGAEGSLAAQIVQMTSLAQQRVAKRTDVQLTRDGSAFAWPSEGRISQSFGCTGVRFNPRRGSCRHFHDGIDMVSAHGSAVRSAAVGVVVFVGWNPWDVRSRAFIVVVAHPDGFVTRYGHLVPGRNIRAGELVRKGQIIGKMGSTGFSTGTHLHMELLRGTTPMDPVAFLPDGVVKVKQPKRSNKKNKASRNKKKTNARKGKSTGAKNSGRPKVATSQVDQTSSACTTEPETPQGLDVAAGDVEELGLIATWAQLASSGVVTECSPESPSAEADDAPESAAPAPATEITVIWPVRTNVPRPQGAALPSRGTSPMPQ